MRPSANLREQVELERRVANVVRYGAIHDVDHARAMARVAYADGENGSPALTGWLPFWTRMAGEDRDWRPPSEGEQVVLLSPFGELASAIILPGLNARAFPAPDASGAKHVTLYRDGARISYDAEAHELRAVLPAGGSAAIEAPDGVTINGALTINGEASATGDISTDANLSADLAVADALGNMQEMRTTYNSHVHGVPPAPVTPPPAPTSLMN